MNVAEELAKSTQAELVYIATATAEDDEMSARIQHHRESRSDQWVLVEEPIALSRAIASCDSPNSILLVDCLTLWLSNCLQHRCWIEQRSAFYELLDSVQSRLLLVNNETGLGVVPLGALSREFVDANGFLNQTLAEVCNKVTFVVSGLPQVLKNA